MDSRFTRDDRTSEKDVASNKNPMTPPGPDHGSTNPSRPDTRPEHRAVITRGVSLMTGDPKTAVWKLSWPMMMAMLLMSLYNLADAIWVAGLGPDALAAVGFITPVFMMFIGLGNGLGAGISSAIARRIGSGNRAGADSAAMHGLIISLAVAVVLSIPLVLYAEPVASALGAGAVAPLAAEYGRIIFAGAVFFLFTNTAYAILRGEGDTRRTMYAIGVSSVLNAVLDPILIYGAGLGIAGAATATVISIALVTAVLLYWFLIKKDTYITFSLQHFTPDRDTAGDILRVGLPASVEYFLMAIVAIFINGVLVLMAGTDAVAVYTSGWRLVMFAIIPDLAISTTLVSVIGAAYGARNFPDMKTAHTYAIRLGTLIAIIMAAVILIFAPQIAVLFTYSEETAYLAPRIALFLRVISLLFFFIPAGMMSFSVFQGTGRGLTSLVINILRNLAFVAVCVVILGILLGYGEVGVWSGIVLGNVLGSVVAYIWARVYISRLVAQEASA